MPIDSSSILKFLYLPLIQNILKISVLIYPFYDRASTSFEIGPPVFVLFQGVHTIKLALLTQSSHVEYWLER